MDEVQLKIDFEKRKKRRADSPDSKSPIIYEESLDDINRVEMLWDHKSSSLVRTYSENAKKQSKLHGISARRNKRKFIIISIPTMIVPVLTGTLRAYLAEYPLIQCLLMLFSGLLSVIQTVFNYGKKSEKHFNFEASYGELANRIDFELIKGKKHRQQADVFLCDTLNRVNALNSNAPPC